MTKREVDQHRAAPAAVGPYSQAIRAGDSSSPPGSSGPTRTAVSWSAMTSRLRPTRALANLRAILDAAGSGLDRLVKMTVFLVDIGDWPAVNEVYAASGPAAVPGAQRVRRARPPQGRPGRDRGGGHRRAG